MLSERGSVSMRLVAVALVLALAVLAALVVKQRSGMSAARAALAAEAASQAERKASADADRAAFEKKAEAAARPDALLMAYQKLEGISHQWIDAAAVADVTARVALAPRVEALQAIRRDAQAANVPPCIQADFQRFSEAMQTLIDGYLAFMADANIGRLVMSESAPAAHEAVKSFERALISCRALYRPQ